MIPNGSEHLELPDDLQDRYEELLGIVGDPSCIDSAVYNAPEVGANNLGRRMRGALLGGAIAVGALLPLVTDQSDGVTVVDPSSVELDAGSRVPDYNADPRFIIPRASLRLPEDIYLSLIPPVPPLEDESGTNGAPRITPLLPQEPVGEKPELDKQPELTPEYPTVPQTPYRPIPRPEETRPPLQTPQTLPQPTLVPQPATPPAMRPTYPTIPTPIPPQPTKPPLTPEDKGIPNVDRPPTISPRPESPQDQDERQPIPAAPSTRSNDV